MLQKSIFTTQTKLPHLSEELHICLSAYSDCIMIVINETGGLGSIVLVCLHKVKWINVVKH